MASGKCPGILGTIGLVTGMINAIQNEDHSECSNYKGIFLLSLSGKVYVMGPKTDASRQLNLIWITTAVFVLAIAPQTKFLFSNKF